MHTIDGRPRSAAEVAWYPPTAFEDANTGHAQNTDIFVVPLPDHLDL